MPFVRWMVRVIFCRRDGGDQIRTLVRLASCLSSLTRLGCNLRCAANYGVVSLAEATSRYRIIKEFGGGGIRSTRLRARDVTGLWLAPTVAPSG